MPRKDKWNDDWVNKDGIYCGPGARAGGLSVSCGRLKSLGCLRRVAGDLIVYKSSVSLISLGDLERVGGTVYLASAVHLKNLGSLISVGGPLFLPGDSGAPRLEPSYCMECTRIEYLHREGWCQYCIEMPEYRKVYDRIAKAPLVDLPLLRMEVADIFLSIIDKRFKGEL